MAKYQGHKNWAHWSVSLWISNDEGLYRLALGCIRHTRNRDDAADLMLDELHDMGVRRTPDGAEYNKTNIKAAMVGLT